MATAQETQTPLPVTRLPKTRFGRLINHIHGLDTYTAAEKAVVGFLAPKRLLPNSYQRAILDTAQISYHQVDGIPLRKYVWPNIPGSPYVMLGHGFMMNAASMLKFVRPLLQAGFAVVAWDQPAHGDSHGESTFVQTWANTFPTIAQSHTPLAGIIGFSLSGTTALMGLAENPNFTCPLLVCINSPTQVDTVMKGFLLKHGCSLDLLPHMHHAAAFKGWRLPEVDKHFMVEGRGLSSTELLFIQDHNDLVASEAEVKYWESMVDNATVEMTFGLGHQGILGRDQWVEKIVAFLDNQSRLPRKLRSRL